MNEKVKISVCCKREAVPYYDDQKDKFMCPRCGFACEVTEVCADCHDTKEVVIDVEDGEGHTMRGVGTEKCRKCSFFKEKN